ncbi:hypothetical protein IW146_002591 [Coemansia sp. RSA 922]|nr:hypothetical protein H4S03_000087 [Coemansia sp. S3946]KAJ2054307.1 hypothetical protein H4S04_000063 [Coemansia sp. S16]KAJ2075402.1 hypothetical protein GGH13_000636 [Coemansia sp. S155-1]KAJ2115081.1 hypothetical protein IW146_002591 [Coemansia sp. RSA 922]KAJ2354164.1 hypothetical protein GGH92_000201 [Coemansia sp. RSA 2673]
MKLSSAITSILLLGTTLVVALSDKEKSALTTFAARNHPNDHTVDTLIVELSEYSANAEVTAAKTMFAQKKYGPASQALSDHLATIKSDPLVQSGKPFAMSFAMLNDCVSELRSKVK